MTDYSCNRCLKKFTSQSNLKRHYNNKNPCSSPDIKPELILEKIDNDNIKVYQELQKIYGIGDKKIKSLIKKGIKSIDDLKKQK